MIYVFCGGAGTGKGYTAKSIVSNLLAGSKGNTNHVDIHDPHGEYREFAKTGSCLVFNTDELLNHRLADYSSDILPRSNIKLSLFIEADSLLVNDRKNVVAFFNSRLNDSFDVFFITQQYDYCDEIIGAKVVEFPLSQNERVLMGIFFLGFS